MSNNDNAHFVRMKNGLERFSDECTAAEFAEQFNRNETFARIEYLTDNKLLFCYPQCYCPCVKRIPQNLPLSWCYCTLGNAQGIFENLFRKKVYVTLVETVKSGGDKCAI